MSLPQLLDLARHLSAESALSRRKPKNQNNQQAPDREQLRLLKSQNANSQPRVKGKFRKRAAPGQEEQAPGQEEEGRGAVDIEPPGTIMATAGQGPKRRYTKKHKQSPCHLIEEQKLPALPVAVLAMVHYREQASQGPLIKAEHLQCDQLLPIPGASQFSTIPGKPVVAPFHNDASQKLKDLEHAHTEGQKSGREGLIVPPPEAWQVGEHAGVSQLGQGDSDFDADAQGMGPLVVGQGNVEVSTSQTVQTFIKRPAGRAPKGANGLPKVWNPAQGAYVEAAELVAE